MVEKRGHPLFSPTLLHGGVDEVQSRPQRLPARPGRGAKRSPLA